MRSAPRSAVLLVVVALLVAGGAVTPALASGDRADPAAVDGPTTGRLDQPANTTVEIRLYANASARLTVTTVYLLENGDERTAFEEYAAAYRAGETDDGPRADPFVAAADRASETTGREMAVTNVTRAGGVDGATGSVSVTLRWTDVLAREDAETLRLDGALALGDDRSWLGSLAADQTLVVRTPPGYSIVDSGGPAFEIRDNAVRFEGPREFEDRLSVTYRQTAAPATDGPDESVPVALLGGGAALVALALVGGYVLTRRRPGGTPGASADDGPSGSGSETATDGSETADAGSTETGTDDDPEPDSEPDPGLLSDDERVMRLLERNDGRMKQAVIVDETGWSDAKVSQLLSSMADEGRVEKLRLGRENLISLPDDDTTE